MEKEVGRYQISVTSDEDYIYVVRVDTRTGDKECIKYNKNDFLAY